MTDADMRRPTEGESMGKCLTEIIEFLELLEIETEIKQGETQGA
jgi:hypothetical protein